MKRKLPTLDDRAMDGPTGWYEIEICKMGESIPFRGAYMYSKGMDAECAKKFGEPFVMSCSPAEPQFKFGYKLCEDQAAIDALSKGNRDSIFIGY